MIEYNLQLTTHIDTSTNDIEGLEAELTMSNFA